MLDCPPSPRCGQRARRSRGCPATEVTVHSVTDLSPRLGSAVVLRVVVEWDRHAPGGGRRDLVVKVPGWGGQSFLDSRDPLLDGREVRFLRGNIPDLLPQGLSVPPDAVVVSDGGREWIFMRDIAASLNRPWTPDSAGVAAVRAALLYAPGASDPALLDTPWLERHGFVAYRHHVETCHENLEAISGDSRLDGLFSGDEIRRLQGFLDRTDELITRGSAAADLGPRRPACSQCWPWRGSAAAADRLGACRRRPAWP